MKRLIFCIVFVVFGLTDSIAEPVSIKAPDLTRKNSGESCKIPWIVTGTFSNYSIVSLTTGNPNTYTGYDSVKGIITLYIWNVQTQDGGYYALTVKTGSTQPDQSSNAILFVYGPTYGRINTVSGRTQFTEGDTIELNCTGGSNSIPIAFQKKFYYFWNIGLYGILQNISSGQALASNGDIATGYSFRNNGQNLVINTTQITYFSSSFYCSVQEEGSSFPFQWSYYFSGITLYHRPFIYSVIPPSKRYNVASTGGSALFQFSVYSVPALSSYSNFTLVDSNGNVQTFPLSTNVFTTNYAYVYVPLSVPRSYGNYSMTLTNNFSSTIVTFQVAPSGAPDVPNDFNIRYVTHSLVSLQWRCGWYNGAIQTVTVLLRNSVNSDEVEISNTSLASNPNCYNSLFSNIFQWIVDPDTEYEASIWSTNTYGQSTVATVTVVTPLNPSLTVTCDNISITDSTAIVNVTTSVVGFWLNVTCCVETKAQCITQSMTLLTTENQITIDSIPFGDSYVFDFILFNRGFNYEYNLAVIKGIRKSRTTGCIATNCSPSENDPLPGNSTSVSNHCDSHLIAIIALSVALGVSVLLLVICFIVILRLRCQTPTKQNNSLQQTHSPSSANNYDPMNRESQLDPYGNYEGIMENGNDSHYTPLEDLPPPPKPPQIPMQRF